MPATCESARLAAHNERRHPAKRARSCASKPHWGFDCFATAQPRLRGLRGCEQGATVERGETGERAMFAPAGRITARAGLRSKLAAIVLAAKRSPLRTPKRRSRSKKAKPCRSAARFLTLFRPSPSGPSGAKTGRRGRRPLRIGHTSGRGEHCSPANLAITQTATGAHCAPLHPLSRYREFGPEGINLEGDEKTLRKLQHSCNF